MFIDYSQILEDFEIDSNSTANCLIVAARTTSDHEEEAISEADLNEVAGIPFSFAKSLQPKRLLRFAQKNSADSEQPRKFTTSQAV